MAPQTDYVLALEDGHLNQLTDTLSLPPKCGIARPTRQWLRGQEQQLSRLPRSVLRPSGFLRRLAIKLSESGAAAPVLPPAAVLCATHRVLHPWLVRGMFNLLAAEVTMRCDRLAGCLSAAGGELLGEGPRRAVEVALGTLRSINALWLEDEHFRMLFGEQAKARDEGRLRRVESGCEACILAAVGSRGELLASLRASMLARAGRREPRLLRVVESWIRWFGSDADGVMEGSDFMAKELCRAWRRAKRGARPRRAGSKRSAGASSRGSRAESGGAEHGRRKQRGGPQYSDRDTLEDPWTPADMGNGPFSDDYALPDPFDDSYGLSEYSDGQEGPVCEGSVAEWYARSEAAAPSASASGPHTRSVHPAFRASDAPPSGYDEEPPLEADGGSGSAGESWTSCSVRTFQPAPRTNATADARPPSPRAPPVPDFDKRASSYTVPIYASSSVYDADAGPPTSLVPGAPLPCQVPGSEGGGRSWAGVGDRMIVFRNPFVGDNGRGREEGEGKGAGESREVSPGTLPHIEGGWI